MAEFLSARWIGELDAAARQLAGVDGGADGTFVIEQVVREAPGGEIHYQVRLGGDGITVTPGHDAPADLVLLTDYPTARRLHEGLTRAQDALAAGLLKVRGAPEQLGRRAEILAALDDAFAPVRARTTFTDDGGPSTRER